MSEERILQIIKTARINKRISQEAIAFELRISQNAYCKIENGKINLTIRKLISISAILDLNFFCFEEFPSE